MGGMAVAVMAAPLVVFSARAPVLVVTEAPFIALYGEARLQAARASARRALFRRVKPVLLADGVSPDMVIFALGEAARRPACVLFPRSQATAALRFHEQFPDIPAAVLCGLAAVPELPPPDGLLCVYATDREADMYRAGLFAGILGSARRPQAQHYVFWQDRFMPEGGRELFSRGVREYNPEANALFINVAAQLPDLAGIACITLTGAGAEYLERTGSVPQILFGWLDPAMLPRDVLVQFDDSVWALAAPAARMALSGQAAGKIPSEPLIFSAKIADNSVFRRLEKSAKKRP